MPKLIAEDFARTRVSILFQGTAPATADTLLTLVPIRDGVAGGGVTSVGVTAGRKLRLTSVEFSLTANAAAAAFGTMTLRQNPSGATVIGSQSEGAWSVGNTENVAGAARAIVVPFAHTVEFGGAQSLGVSLSAQATTNIISICLRGYEYTPAVL